MPGAPWPHSFMRSRLRQHCVQGARHDWVRDALDDNWLFSLFHPIVDANTGTVFAHEALIRARRPADAGDVIGAGPIIDATVKP